MENFTNLASEFLNNNALSIILVSIIFSLITIYITIYDIKLPIKKYVKTRTIIIE